MTDMDYRDMANEIRALVPLLIHPKTVADLRSLADRYERLARCLEVMPGTRQLVVVKHVDIAQRSAYGISGKTTRLTFDRDWWNAGARTTCACCAPRMRRARN